MRIGEDASHLPYLRCCCVVVGRSVRSRGGFYALCRLFLFVVLFIWPCLANADSSFPGYDVLALAKYCDTYLQAPKLPAVSTLLNTFGDPLPCLEKRIKQGALSLAQIDLIDATCWRNNKCPPGAPRPDDLKVIESRAKQVRALAVKYKDVRFQVSPALEHDVRNETTVKRMLQAAKKGCPECEPINSPFTGARPAGYAVEKHGTQTNGDLVSGDGQSSFDGDNIEKDGNRFQHRIAGKIATFAWWPELNLRTTGEDKFTPPLQRTVRPNLDQFRQAFRIFSREEENLPDAPLRCQKIRTVNGREIVKTNAEQYGNGVPPDVRGNKPMLIIRKGGRVGERLSVYDTKGKEIGCFRYYGVFTEKPLHRWYMGDCSGQTPEQLYRDARGEWVFVDLGGKECLRINAIRRMGVYR